MNLKELQEKYNIKRIDFDKVKPVEVDDTFATDEIICPYCGEAIDFDAESVDDILQGTSYQCPICDKWFMAYGEMSINTVCAPMENEILERREIIEDEYKYMDMCDENGCNWDATNGTVEYRLYKKYAEPYFANQIMEDRR